MKKLIILTILMGLVFTCSVATAGSLCWKFEGTPDYPDTIKITADNLSTAYPTPVAGSWITDVGNHKALIAMSGSLQKDLDCGNLRLILQGTVKDLSLSYPFIYQCNIDATLDPKTLESVEITVPNTFNYHSSVLAYCENYFQPDNPFTTNVKLIPVSCNKVLNP
jgi:hypothetical protein